jgi:hypothetical protein
MFPESIVPHRSYGMLGAFGLAVLTLPPRATRSGLDEQHVYFHPNPDPRGIG